jgi:hypothetical protein
MVLSLLVWLIALVAGPAQPRCSLNVEFLGPSADRTIVLVAATAESVGVPLPDHALLSDRFPDTTRGVVAYRFRVIQAAGGATDQERLETFLAVPWKYDSACALMPWGSDEWVPAGEEAVFALMRRRTVAAGEPLYDLLGEHLPYPQGAFLKYESTPAPPSDRAEWLSAREYFALLTSLPEMPAEDGAVRLERFERVFAAGDRRWSSTFPGAEILLRARQVAGRK